ncbi:MAG TPA: hypothetical protein VHL57_08445 [Flavobacteriales bacterium]|jgi:hypothetical protein|nr:hypothetical protein [Flavobacteriales bacterium]
MAISSLGDLLSALQESCEVLEETVIDDHIKEFTLFDPVDVQAMDQALAASSFIEHLQTARDEGSWNITFRMKQGERSLAVAD